MELRPLLLEGMPLPPSANELQRTRRPFRSKKTGKLTTVRYDTDNYREFKKAFKAWSDGLDLKTLQAWSKEIEARGLVVEISCTFFLKPERRFMKSGTALRQFDPSNLVKAAHDQISDLIGLDDRYFEVGPHPTMISKWERVRALLTPVELKYEVPSES